MWISVGYVLCGFAKGSVFPGCKIPYGTRCGVDVRNCFSTIGDISVRGCHEGFGLKQKKPQGHWMNLNTGESQTCPYKWDGLNVKLLRNKEDCMPNMPPPPIIIQGGQGSDGDSYGSPSTEDYLTAILVGIVVIVGMALCFIMGL